MNPLYPHTAIIRFCLVLTVCIGASSTSALAQADTPMTAKSAGARYGQALGVVEICIGSKITEKASALATLFTGLDEAAFKAQAAKVFAAWRSVKACTNDDPNQCKVIMDKNCQVAFSEIGPKGNLMPGLVTLPQR